MELLLLLLLLTPIGIPRLEDGPSLPSVSRDLVSFPLPGVLLYIKVMYTVKNPICATCNQPVVTQKCFQCWSLSHSLHKTKKKSTNVNCIHLVECTVQNVLRINMQATAPQMQRPHCRSTIDHPLNKKKKKRNNNRFSIFIRDFADHTKSLEISQPECAVAASRRTLFDRPSRTNSARNH